MNTLPVQTSPPRWMQSLVSSLLPPKYREPVLGDLQERFGERGGRTRWLGYVGDVLTTVPHVLRSQVRRILTGRTPYAAAVRGDLRSRAEEFQTRIWFRNTTVLVSIVIVIGAFLVNAQGAWHLQEFVNLAMTIGWIGATWQSYGVRGRSTLVPTSLSCDELRAFHRGELIRQMHLGCREFVYWSLPALLLVLYGLTVAATGVRGALMLLALAMQTGVVAWAHRRERTRYQRELVQLDHPVVQP